MVFPLYLSSSYFQSCHLPHPELGEAPSYLLGTAWVPAPPSLPHRGCSPVFQPPQGPSGLGDIKQASAPQALQHEGREGELSPGSPARQLPRHL